MELIYAKHQYSYVHLAAKFAGVGYKATALDNEGQIKKVIHEEGSVPVLKTSEGSITTSLAISRHLARLSSNKTLLGSDQFEEAQVDELMNMINLQVQPLCKSIMYMLTGRIPCENPQKMKHIVGELKANLDWYNKELEGKDFLVGKQITLADIQLAATIAYPLSFAINPQSRNKILNIMNWYHRVTSADGHFESIFGKIKL